MELPAGFTMCGWFAFLLTAFSVTVGGDRDEQLKQGDIELEGPLSLRYTRTSVARTLFTTAISNSFFNP